MQRYDVIVIGSGPGGERAATSAAIIGKRVAVIEKNPALGGASTNTGTLPSKTLRETALAFSGLKSRKLYGVDLSLRREATLREFMYHEEWVKDSERKRVATSFLRQYVDLYRGTASFENPHAIRIVADGSSDLTLEGEVIVIATGSSPLHPPGFPFEDERIHDSDELLTMPFLPKSLAVIGAGVIGSEYACTFAALGCEVHLLDGREMILPFLDRELSLALVKAMQEVGIQFHLKERVKRCAINHGGKVELECESGFTVSTDQILVAAGRTSNTADLNLAAAGITPAERGLLKVDERFRTAVPHILAIGDVIGFPALAATSAEQGRMAMYAAFGVPYENDIVGMLPTGIYTIPEVSTVGETEEALKTKGVDYVVGRASYAESARGRIIGDQEGFLKLLFRREDMKLLGVHVIGETATEVVHIGVMAMMTGSGIELFNQTCFNYPTLGDMYKHAAIDAQIRRERGDNA